MSQLRAALGVLCIAALCICAIGASSASALTLHVCKTIPAGGTGVTTGCPAGQEQVPTVGSQAVKPSLSSASTILKGSVAGIEVEITCTGLSGSGNAENLEVGGDMLIKGSEIVASFEGCSVTKPSGKGCTIPATITTNSMKSETNATTMKQKYTPTSGTTFVTFEVSGASCPAALKGSKSITGRATGESNEAGEQEFTATSGSELKLAGQTATVTGKAAHNVGGSAATARTP